MSFHRRALTLGATTAALGLGAVALPAGASAATAPAAPASATDGLLGLPITIPTIPIVSTLPVVGGIVSGTPATTVPSLPGLEALTTVLGSIPIIGGSDPTAAVAGLPALPIIGTVLGGSGGASPLAALTALLPDLTGLVAGLPVEGLPAGTVPTGGALKPVTDLLRQLAAAAAGTPLATALTTLADQVDGLGDAGVTDDLLTVISSTLGSLAATPGVPPDVQAAAASLATQLAPKPVATTTKPTTTTTTTTTTTPAATKPAATTPAAAAIGRARVRSLRVDRKTGKVRVSVSCPATGPACKTFLTVYRGTRLSGLSALMSIAPGASSTASVKLDAAARKALKKKTTVFKVSAVLPGGKLSTRNVTAKLPKAKKAVKKKAAKK